MIQTSLLKVTAVMKRLVTRRKEVKAVLTTKVASFGRTWAIITESTNSFLLTLNLRIL
jgi:hypothetical protein